MNMRSHHRILLIIICLAFSQVASAFVVSSQNSCNMQDMQELLVDIDNMQMTHHDSSAQTIADCCDQDLSVCCSDNCQCASYASSSVFINADSSIPLHSPYSNRLSFLAIVVHPPDLALPKRPPIIQAS